MLCLGRPPSKLSPGQKQAARLPLPWAFGWRRPAPLGAAPLWGGAGVSGFPASLPPSLGSVRQETNIGTRRRAHPWPRNPRTCLLLSTLSHTRMFNMRCPAPLTLLVGKMGRSMSLPESWAQEHSYTCFQNHRLKTINPHTWMNSLPPDNCALLHSLQKGLS